MGSPSGVSRAGSEAGGEERATGAAEARPGTESVGRADQALAAAAVSALPCAVAVLMPDGSLAYANDAYRRLLRRLPDVGEFHRAVLRACRSRPETEIPLPLTGIPLVAHVAAVSDGLAVLIESQRSEATPGLDELTGLADRAGLVAALDKALATGVAVGLLHIDLERFGMVKNTLGLAVADALLEVVADRLRRALADVGLAARLGGDEFAVLLTGGDRLDDRALELAVRLRGLLARTYIVEGNVIDIDSSIGIACGPRDGAAAIRLLQSADIALRQAEQAGGVRAYEPAMEAETQARRSLELDLRRALARREFALVYQPQLNLAERRVVGFEALLRWHHPERGSVSPADFIPLAEETGLIVPIGEWVLRTACRVAATWPVDTFVAVNVSAAQFGAGLAATVLSALAETRLDPRRLELEITESVLLGDEAAILAVLHSLKELGVRISMDDFGTGFSSLTYLQSFPFDKIKVDRSFIIGRSTGGGGALVRAVAAMGRSMGVPIVAEGVETAEQLAFVEADGCTDAQGFFVGRPAPAAELGCFFADETRGDR